MAGVVWVLGAGFSAGLGAPMLNELLSEHAIKEVNLRFRAPHLPAREQGERMVRIYPKGAQAGMWRDPEEFLDYAETARHDPVRAQLLKEFDSNLGTPQDCARGLQQFVAARVSTFLQGANLASELWAPYLRWARSLTPDDTVITFNWDRVLEMIAKYSSEPVQAMAGRLAGRPPIRLTADSFTAEPGENTRVLKLHGSVDWKCYVHHYRPTDDPLFALGCESDQIAIATPGPAKQGARETFLGPLWERAGQALSHARAVVFVGYRFPPSDSQAREFLLSALSVSAEPGAYRAVHTVLGPALTGDHSARLGGLIRGILDGTGWAADDISGSDTRTVDTPRYSLAQHPLYGQDFMSVFSRERVLDPRTLVPPRAFSWPSAS